MPQRLQHVLRTRQNIEVLYTLYKCIRSTNVLPFNKLLAESENALQLLDGPKPNSSINSYKQVVRRSMVNHLACICVGLMICRIISAYHLSHETARSSSKPSLLCIHGLHGWHLKWVSNSFFLQTHKVIVHYCKCSLLLIIFWYNYMHMICWRLTQGKSPNYYMQSQLQRTWPSWWWSA